MGDLDMLAAPALVWLDECAAKGGHAPPETCAGRDAAWNAVRARRAELARSIENTRSSVPERRRREQTPRPTGISRARERTAPRRADTGCAARSGPEPAFRVEIRRAQQTASPKHPQQPTTRHPADQKRTRQG